MSAKTYPYTAWRLTPGFKPVEVVISTFYLGFDDYNWLVDSAGKLIDSEHLFETKALAIANGWKRLKEMDARIIKLLGTFGKRTAVLEKASAES